MTDLITFLKARLDDEHRRLGTVAHVFDCAAVAGRDEHDDTACNCRRGYLFADIAAKRAIIAEYAPEWQNVEWPHDQNGEGKAQVCRRCQNAEHTHWDPPLGGAGVLPESFVTPYVLAPCTTLRLLALPFASHPDYQESWRP